METLHFERFEYKYFAPEEQTAALRRFISPYVHLDRNAARSADRRYVIHSVYFDTPGLSLWRAGVDDQPRRFKLRVRWYDAEARGPFFCEVKRKYRQVIVKDRADVDRATAEALLAGRRVVPPPGRAGRNLATFQDTTTKIAAAPVMRLRYTREAYESVFGEYARITFDRAMCFQPVGREPLRSAPAGFAYFDAAHATDGVRGALLIELKFTREFPRWMSDLVAEFGLQRCGFSKYSWAMTRHQARQVGGAELQRVAAYAE